MQSIFDKIIDDDIKKPMSDSDILSVVKGKCNVIKYRDLYKYQSVDELLYPYDACVILYETRPNYGHWVALTKHNNLIEYFNSYGDLGKGGRYGMPDSELAFIDRQFVKDSGQDNMYLTKLLSADDCNYDLSYNEFPFQKMDNQSATCGKWAAIRILLKELPLADFKDLFYGKYSDNLVAFLTDNI